MARRRRRAPAYDPFAPLGPRAQNRLIHQTVNSQILPLIAQINAEVKRHAASGESAIAGYTNRFAADIAPLAGQTHQTYADAIAAQTADDKALGDRLAGVGAGVSEGLRQQLAGAIGPGQLDQLTGAAAQQGAAGGAAVQAGGSAAVGALRGAATAAEAYSGQLPGIVKAGGAQRVSQLLQQLEEQRATQVSDIRSKVPGLLASVSAQVRGEQFQKAVAQQSGLIAQTKLQNDTAYKQAKIDQGNRSLDLRAAKARSDALYKKAGLKLSRDRYDLSVKNEHRLERAKAGKSGGYSATKLHDLRTTAIASAIHWKKGSSPVRYANGGVKVKGFPAHPSLKDAPKLFHALVVQGDIPPSMAAWAVGQVYGKWLSPGQKQELVGGHRQRVNRGVGGAGPR